MVQRNITSVTMRVTADTCQEIETIGMIQGLCRGYMGLGFRVQGYSG